MARRNTEFQTIRSEGGLLPPDLLQRILNGELCGTQARYYGLSSGERLNEHITQSWQRLQKSWTEFGKVVKKLKETEPGTGLTNERWTLPLLRELGFGFLPTSAGPVIDNRTYAINRFLGPVPIHLVGCQVDLDRRAARVRGAAQANPHGMVQEFLNRSEAHLWAIVANGYKLRILRDNKALSRQSFLEFDLEAIFTCEVYSDFVLLWMLAHATRFLPLENELPEKCWLEKWAREAEKEGTRALGELRNGVKKALLKLGGGFTSHPKNTKLRESLRNGKLELRKFHRQLLRIVYRLIFLFVAENRTLDDQPLLHPKDDSKNAKQARERYASHYSTNRLRNLAGKIKGSRHGDLWQQFNILIGALSGNSAYETVRTQLSLPILGSMLWDRSYTKEIDDAELANNDFLEVLRNLAFIRKKKVLRPVDYKNLGTEELGGVYESLIGLTPRIIADGAGFEYVELAGNERKKSGSYYTPDSLVQSLLDSALEPVVEKAVDKKSGVEAEKAILDLKVCDPAVGSGHFLIGAAHRLARHLARVRALAEGDSEPSPLLYQQALRDVIGRCLYGVDSNPMAVELCRVGLWMEALEPGKPLSFLEHHISVGNSLLGTTPNLIKEGIPNEAFKPIEASKSTEDDDKKTCAILKKYNKAQREELGALAGEEETKLQEGLFRMASAIEELPDDCPDDIYAKELAYRRYKKTDEYTHKKQLADLWCGAFVIKKRLPENSTNFYEIGITHEKFMNFASDAKLPTNLAEEVNNLTVQYQFFHWHLIYPEVYAKGGFDCVLGNPPWERVKIQEKEWFAKYEPEIANAPNAAARKRKIKELEAENTALFQQFAEEIRKAAGHSHFLRNSGVLSLCARGDINLYAVFAEHMRDLLNVDGRMGCVLPTGIATDDTTKNYFQDIVKTNSLISLYDFENRSKIFPNIDSRLKFCLLTASRGTKSATTSEFVFFAHEIDDIKEPERLITLTSQDIALINPNTFTCPIFRSRKDALLTRAIYRRVPILIREARDGRFEENPWGIKFNAMFHMANASYLFKTKKEMEDKGYIEDELIANKFVNGNSEFLPLYEAKMMHQYDHRFNTYEKSPSGSLSNMKDIVTSFDGYKEDPRALSMPRYWVQSTEVDKRWISGSSCWTFVLRNITRATDRRTAIFSILPKVGFGDTAPVMNISKGAPEMSLCLYGSLASFVFDFAARQSVGGTHLTYFILKQLPVLLPSTFVQVCPWSDRAMSLSSWLLPRIIELTYTAWDLEPFARDFGIPSPPFRWDDQRRFLLRCELDAAYFHLYLPSDQSGNWRLVEDETPEELKLLKGLFSHPRDAVNYILATFSIVQQQDEQQYSGDFRTKRVILEIYDAMQDANRNGNTYKSLLNPPPADPSCRNQPRV